MGSGNGAETTLRVRVEWRVRQRGGVDGWHIVVRNGTEAPLHVKIYLAKICAADAHRILQHCGKHRLKIAGEH